MVLYEGIVLIIFLALLITGWIRNLGSLNDKGEWSDSARPSKDAKIVDVTTRKVEYTKNNAKFMTVVRFSDGFVYQSHDTDREDHTFTYSIRTDREKICKKAIEAHIVAVEKNEREYQKRLDKVFK